MTASISFCLPKIVVTVSALLGSKDIVSEVQSTVPVVSWISVPVVIPLNISDAISSPIMLPVVVHIPLPTIVHSPVKT
jgi:hypothetical protein